MCHAAFPVVDEVPPAANEIETVLGLRARENLRIGEDEIGRRQHVENLTGREFDLPLVLGRDAANAGGGVVPPLLLQQEGLMDDVERPAPPGIVGEAFVLLEGLDADTALGCERAGAQEMRQAHALAQRLVPELHLLARRRGEMNEPIEIRLRQGRRRHAERGLRHLIADRAVDDVAGTGGRIIIGRRRGRRLRRVAAASMRTGVRGAHGRGRCRNRRADAAVAGFGTLAGAGNARRPLVGVRIRHGGAPWFVRAAARRVRINRD